VEKGSNVLPRARRSPSSPWTRERIAWLKARWAQGATAEEIAKELAHGISRNAVLATIHRLGIVHLSPFGGRRGRRRKRGRHDRAGDRRVKRAAGGTAPGHRARVPASPSARSPGSEQPNEQRNAERQLPAWVRNATPYVDDPRVDADVPHWQRCSFLELSSSTCRWPVGDPARPDFLFCGARPLEGKPYCGAHWARAYRKDTALRPWQIEISPCRQTR
jgi:GcrA cell cycle regulator